jgi:uncharacterized protein
MEGAGTVIRIEGMTCPSCVARVEKALRSVRGVASAKASLGGDQAELIFEEGFSLDPQAVGTALATAGYAYGGLKARKRGVQPGTLIALLAGALLSALYLFLNAKGVFNAIPEIGAGLSLGMLFGAGLLTSVHCVSMCGGIALSQSLPGAASEGATGRGPLRAARFLPGLLYNLGRVLGYSVIGAIAGGLGKAFSFSSAAKALISLAAGLFMVLFGLRNLGIIKLPAFGKRILPDGARRFLGRMRDAFARRGPLAVGLLNALIPCGPLQAMQLYALGTGSAFMGAISMAVFALGTLPLMMGFAGVAGILPRRFMPVLVKAGAVMTLALGVVTFGRSAAFAGLGIPGVGLGGTALAAEPSPGTSRSPAEARTDAATTVKKAKLTRDRLPEGVPVAVLKNGIQYVETRFSANEYAPFAVVGGIPAKWTIKISAADLNGCNRSIIVPEYKIRKDLKPGDNIVEFTPKSSGVVSYSCWMGMIRSAFAVLDE